MSIRRTSRSIRPSNDWIFSLDADERSQPGAVRRNQRTGTRKDSTDLDTGFRGSPFSWDAGSGTETGIRTTSCVCLTGRCGRWEGGRVHESVKMKEKPDLPEGGNPAFHVSKSCRITCGVSKYIRTSQRFDYQQKGKIGDVTPSLLGNPMGAFVKAYLLKRGFLDGTPGFAVAVMGAVSVFFKYAKLYELRGTVRVRRSQKSASPPAEPD